VWLDKELRDAFDVAVARSRRSLTEETAVALEYYLASLSLWPPAPPEDN
jgi:hypothetical protein